MDDFVPTPEMLEEAEIEAEWLRLTHGNSEFSGHWLDSERNRRLKQALTAASEAEQHIESEQSRIRGIIERKLEEGKEVTDVEREAREFQIWYVEVYLQRAARLANERIRYFREEVVTREQIDAENEKCKNDKEHWFRYYGWGYDPRARTPISNVPFELYPRQVELVEWLDDIVFNLKSSGLIEKARDEGATELAVRWGIHNWNYREGFSMLLSSRTEDEVDTKKKLGTLFERARFQIRRLPDWMLPEDFEIEKALLADKMISAPNGNALSGQAPVENMGRGDRVTCALFDEFAFWRFAGYPQFASMSQTTDSIIMPSSVAGKFNQFADLAIDGVTPKFEMDWRDNPFKDQRWFNSLPYGYISPKMTTTTIAQEVERNYSASQPGKVWKIDETRIFITWSEFVQAFPGREKRFIDLTTGRNILPKDWSYTRTHDYGQSEGHDWAYLLGAQPQADWAWNDTHFIFIARNLEPTGLTTEQAVKLWRNYEFNLGLRDAMGKWIATAPRNYHSHEQLELRDVLLQTYGEQWDAWNTDYFAGITTIEDWWRPIDLDKPNPFRPDIAGRCRLVFVAPDGEYQMAFNERLNSYFVTISNSEAGFNLARKQIDAYHYPLSERGKPAKAMRPLKEFDDIIDTIRGYSLSWNRKPAPLTLAQAREHTVPANLRLEAIEARAGDQDPELTSREIQTHDLYASLHDRFNAPRNEEEGGHWSL